MGVVIFLIAMVLFVIGRALYDRGVFDKLFNRNNYDSYAQQIMEEQGAQAVNEKELTNSGGSAKSKTMKDLQEEAKASAAAEKAAKKAEKTESKSSNDLSEKLAAQKAEREAKEAAKKAEREAKLAAEKAEKEAKAVAEKEAKAAAEKEKKATAAAEKTDSVKEAAKKEIADKEASSKKLDVKTVLTMDITAENVKSAISSMKSTKDSAEDEDAVQERKMYKVQSGVTVLVVEDRAEDSNRLKTIVEETGASCDVAENGIRALAMVREKKYDMIFLAATMARMDGTQVMRNMKKLDDSQCKEAMVYAVVERDSVEPEIYFDREGFTATMRKPVGEYVVWRKIHAAIAQDQVISDPTFVKEMLAIAREEAQLQEYGVVLSEGLVNFKGDFNAFKERASQYVDEYTDVSEEIQDYLYAGDAERYMNIVREHRELARKLGAIYLSEILDDHVNMAKNSDMEIAEASFRALELEWENVVTGLAKWLGKEDGIRNQTAVLISE